MKKFIRSCLNLKPNIYWFLFLWLFLFYSLYTLTANEEIYRRDIQKMLSYSRNHTDWFFHMNLLNEETLSVDTSSLKEHDLVERLEPQLPNLPLHYWQENKERKMQINDSCAPFPDIYDLRFNKYWQVMESSNGSYHLYAAYLDIRELNLLGPTVRLLAMIDRMEPWYLETYCQLWFNETLEPLIVKVEPIYLIWSPWWANYAEGLFQVWLFF